jgi:hypothetical protein
MRFWSRAAGFAIAALVAATASGAAHAQTQFIYGPFAVDQVRPNVAYLNGEIVRDTADNFLAMLEEHPDIVLLVLNSPGGLTEVARAVAETIYALGIDTFIPEGAECLSACSTIYFGGRQHVVMGELGVHRSVSSRPFDNSAQIAALLGFTLESWMHFGVPIEAILATYRTRNEEIHVFTPEEVVRFGLNRGEVSALQGLTSDLLARLVERQGADLVVVDRDFDAQEEHAGALAWRLVGPVDNPAILGTLSVPGQDLRATIRFSRNVIHGEAVHQIEIAFRGRPAADHEGIDRIDRFAINAPDTGGLDLAVVVDRRNPRTFAVTVKEPFLSELGPMMFGKLGFVAVLSFADGMRAVLFLDKSTIAADVFATAAAAWGFILDDADAP